MIKDFILELIFLAGYGWICVLAGVMWLWKSLEKKGLVRWDEGCYHEPSTCNRCGGMNEIKIKECIEHTMCEAETKCQSCKFEDYWAYGYFESSQIGLDFCKKYRGGK